MLSRVRANPVRKRSFLSSIKHFGGVKLCALRNMLSSAPKKPPIFVGGFFGIVGRVRTRVLSRVRNHVRVTDNFKIFQKNIDEWKNMCYNNRK